MGEPIQNVEGVKFRITPEPYLLFQERPTGIKEAIDAITADIDEGGDIPKHILEIVCPDVVPVCAPDPDERPTPEAALAATAGEDETILLTKPANTEQLTIAREIMRNNVVLVQGPPGTGKTHTIANLLGHFLAQGQRVLVTSHTAKALTVLKAKLPEAIQPLWDEEEDNADDLQLAFDDRESKWLGSWLEVKPTFVKTSTTVQKQVEAASVVNYVVKKGDTLWAIAKKYLGSGTKYPQIASENNIKNPNLIYPGQVFKITTGGTATQTVSETKETTKKVSDPKLITATIVQKNWHDNGKDVHLNCGTFELDSVDASGPPTKITLKGTSIPYTSTMRVARKSKAWENTTLKVIAEQIAKESCLKLMYLAGSNPKYKRKEQVQQSDIVFLQKLCKAAGLALKVTTMNVVIYDAEEYDSKPPIKTIKYGSGDYLSYKLGTSLHDTAYTSCHVSYTDPDSKETIESTYTPDSTEGTGQVLEINEKVNSTSEAHELAKKRLREKNTQQYTASFTMLGDVQLVAGATVRLKGFQKFDRKYKITKATHKLTGGYTTQIELKQVLEGY